MVLQLAESLKESRSTVARLLIDHPHSYREWKDTARNRLAFWGGGVNTQSTLMQGSTAEVAAEARDVAQYMGQDGGYIFCNIHNLLAEVEPEKILALYRAV